MKTVVVMHPSGNSAWACSFPETPSESPISPHSQMIFDLGKEIESLRQQLADMTADRDRLLDVMGEIAGSKSLTATPTQFYRRNNRRLKAVRVD